MTQTQVTADTFYSKMPTVDQLVSYIEQCETSIKTSIKNMDYRAENYYNCVDDYSYGGICDKVASENISANKRRIEMFNEQMNNGAFIQTEFIEVLCDMDNKIVSDNVIDGKFGSCWRLTAGGFVSIAKKESTYAKKGYKTMSMAYTIEYYLTGGETQKGNNKCVSRLISSELVSNNEDAMWGKSWYLWCALNNK